MVHERRAGMRVHTGLCISMRSTHNNYCIMRWLAKIYNKIKKAALYLFNKKLYKAMVDAENAELVFHKTKESIADYDVVYFDKFIENATEQYNLYIEAGQWIGASKLEWLIQIAGIERELPSIGVTKAVSAELVMELCRKHESRVLKLSDVASYERAIPRDIVMMKKKLESVFQEFFVLYTDHTVKRQVADSNVSRSSYTDRGTNSYNSTHVRRDPIMFGMFCEDVKIGKKPAEGERDTRVTSRLIGDRMYLIGDWEDEFCDLTFAKMVDEISSTTGRRVDNSACLRIDGSKLVADRLGKIRTMVASRGSATKASDYFPEL